MALSPYGFSHTGSLLAPYLALKDALVADNPTLAATRANELGKLLTTHDTGLTKKDHDVLLKAATQIAGSNDIKVQREYFAILSGRLITLATQSKLSDQKLYLMYCPMKKSNWLSSEKEVKNPYYGKSMLTCGTVKEIVN